MYNLCIVDISITSGSWEDWVRSAFFARVSLSSTGFHATPGLIIEEKNIVKFFTITINIDTK